MQMIPGPCEGGRDRAPARDFRSARASARLPRRFARGGAGSVSAGFTLLELMVVLGIVGIVLGIGAGMFLASREDAALRTGYNGLLSLARYAHTQALVRRVPATLLADLSDPAEPRVDVLIDRTFGLWHAEDLKTTGAYGLDGRASGVSLEPGKIGFAFQFKGAGSVRVEGLEIPVGADALTVEAWVNPSEVAGRQAVVEKKGEFSLRLENNGELTGGFGGARLRAADVRIALEQWSHLCLIAEGGACALELNGREVAAGPLNRIPASTGNPVVIGEGFHGLVDEVVIRGRVPEETVRLQGLALVAGGAAADPDPKQKGKRFRVHFTPEGRLDARYHRGPVTLTLSSPKASQAVKIGWMGTVEP